MKISNFAERNIKEIMRDPLGIVFCLIFPLIMIGMFQIFKQFSEGAYWFRIDILMPGVMVFSYAFAMLYIAILVSKDKTTSFLQRMFVSPMKTWEYIMGYLIPGIIIGFMQILICIGGSLLVGSFTDIEIPIGGSFMAFLVHLSILICMVSFGIIFGSLFSEKSAPGISSIIITVSAVLSGAWMPVETMGAFKDVCEMLPWYPATSMGREILFGSDFTWKYLWIDIGYAAVIFILACVCFRWMKNRDEK